MHDITTRTLVMGILNRTPDSFFDRGATFGLDDLLRRAEMLATDGADLLDVGGVKAGPGPEVSESEELDRVVPTIEALHARLDVPISVDTSKSAVAREALRAGARIVNDISGLRFDEQMIDVCLEFPCGIVCMHMRGTPETMQRDPHYTDVVTEICGFFAERLDTLGKAGIAANRIALDPGIGFGKTAQHNVEILSSIRQIQSLGRPVLIGHSRKGFLQKVIGRPVDERLFGTIGVSIALAHQGVDILRVHDVAANRDAITAFLATAGS